MQFLRGTENFFIDLGCGSKALYLLRDMVHEYNLKYIEMWLKTDVDGILLMDDWGAQKSLLIAPSIWREFLKPLYKEYCNLIHAHNKYVFFHSDGYIEEVFDEVLDIGIDAINSQLFCMDIEKLAKKYKGKITFWGEVDRQRLLPFGSIDEVKSAVYRLRKAFDDGTGGIIAQCEWGKNVPVENIEEVFISWNKPLEDIS
jgi:uroporphyrinogen-III decarboxylase